MRAGCVADPLDADLELAADAALEAAYLCAGQSCTAGERFLVQAGARAEFTERVVEATKARVRPGDPVDPPTASSARYTNTLIAISAVVTAVARRDPAPLAARSAATVTRRIPCGLPECSGQRNPTGAGVMHS